MSDKHLVVISVDALVFEDLEYAKTLPNFARIMKNGSMVERVRTIWPSVTHPVHASIITGQPSGVTTIINNTPFEPGNPSPVWFNMMHQMPCETIFHAAHRAGLTSAVCCWPVTEGGNDVVDYLVPELFGLGAPGSDPMEVLKERGVSESVMDIMAETFKVYEPTTRHPVYDELEIYSAANIIRKYKPNLMFCHPGYVDGERHRTGLFTDAVEESLRHTDKCLGMMLDALEDAGIADKTDFIVCSDHGQMNIVRSVCINVFLAEAGFIKTDENGDLISWDAMMHSSGMSGYVYLSRPDDEKLKGEVGDLLRKMVDDGIYGLDRVYTREEAKEKYGVDGDFSFVLSADNYTSLHDDWKRPIVRSFDPTDYRYGRATHGHSPEKGPQPTLLAMGPSIKPGVVIPEGHVLDHAATFAKILGIDFPQAQGTAAAFVK